MFYAALVSTQDNAQMFRLQLIPGDSFNFNLQAVLDRNIARLMFNTLAVATMVTVGKVVLSIFSGNGAGLLPLSRQVACIRRNPRCSDGAG